MQNTDISADPADSCAIYMTVHHASGKKLPALSAHCRFDDHIQCVAAKKNLSHKRESLRSAKMATISNMLDLPTQPTGCTHPIGLHYSKLTIVNDNVSHAPLRGSHNHMSSDHVITSPLVKKEAIQLANKNDDGSVMLPFNKGVEMDTLGSFAAPQSPKQQHLNMLLKSSSFSHEERHLDQRQEQNSNFNQRQLSIDQQQQNDDQATGHQRENINEVTKQCSHNDQQQ